MNESIFLTSPLKTLCTKEGLAQGYTQVKAKPGCEPGGLVF